MFIPAPPLEPGILFEDRFEDPASEWFTHENTEFRWWIDGGQYNALVKVPYQPMISWRDHMGPFDNFRLDVDTEQIGGPDGNAYGVIFRVQDDANYYRFLISGNGYFSFDKVVAGQATSIIPPMVSYEIHQGASANHLTVFADSDQFSLLINGAALPLVTDSQFASGEIGVLAGMSAPSGQVHIAFDNVILTELP